MEREVIQRILAHLDLQTRFGVPILLVRGLDNLERRVFPLPSDRESRLPTPGKVVRLLSCEKLQVRLF